MHASFAFNPVDESCDSNVNSGMFLLRAVEAPAGDTLQHPMPRRGGKTDQRTTGVALARVLATLRVAGAEHVAGDLVVVPFALVA